MPSDEQLAAMSVADAMNRWPQIMPLFISHRLACCGCALAQFCTIRDVAESYEHIVLAPFIVELKALIANGKGDNGKGD